MGFAGFKLCAVALLAACCVPNFACAGDIADQGGSAASKLDAQIDQAVKSGSATASPELDSRIRDLESTRTAIDQQKKSAVSLSVSGWVDQQVQYNVK